MHRGFVKVFRKILDWEWYGSSETVHLFLHLLLTANHKDSKYMGVVIPRGSCIIGRVALSKVLTMSEQTLRTCLTRLKSTSEITIKTTNKFSIVSLCNYEAYQGQENEINQQINQQTNQPLTSNQPATNQQLTTSKECKNERMKRNKSVFVPPSFEEFQAYCKEFGFLNIAKRAFDGYVAGEWHDVEGKPILKWKQKLHNGWFNERNKDTPPFQLKTKYLGA